MPLESQEHKLKVTISEGMQLTGGYVGTDLDSQIKNNINQY